MLTYMPLLIGFLAGLIVFAALWHLFVERSLFRSKHKKRMEKLMMTAPAKEGAVKKVGLEDKLRAAGFEVKPGAVAEFTTMRAGLALLSALGMLVLGLPLLLAALAGAAGWYLPVWYVNNRIRGRAKKMEEEMPVALAEFSATLSSQPDIGEALARTAEVLRAADPDSVLAKELAATAADYANRKAAALVDLSRRAPTPSLARFAFALRIYHEAGGEFSKAMEKAAQRAQKLMEGRKKGVAKAATSRVFIILIIILFAGVTLYLFQDPQFRHFYNTLLGQVVLAGTVAFMFLGWQVVNSMIDEVV